MYEDTIARGQHISIVEVDNGFVVTCGCVTLVFNDPKELAVELTRYVHAPKKVRAEYEKKYRPLNVSMGAGRLARVSATEEPLREEAFVARASAATDQQNLGT